MEDELLIEISKAFVFKYINLTLIELIRYFFKKGMHMKTLLSAILLSTISTASFANESIIDSQGYALDDEYYLSDTTQSEPEAQSRSARSNNAFEQDFHLKVLSKGAFTYTMKVTWVDAYGNQSQFARHNVFAKVPLNFTIPAGARDVFLTTTVNDGFYGKPVIAAQITPSTVAQGAQNFTEYHMWGTTFWPKWRQMD